MSIEPIFSRLEAHPKGWGDELWITNNEKYCGKILRFNEGSSFSMHYHILKEETWCVTKGKLILEYYDLDKAEKLSKTLEALGECAMDREDILSIDINPLLINDGVPVAVDALVELYE